MIRIKNIRLENFHGFTDTTIHFEKNLTCIAGINGAGKSTILAAVKTMLSWLVEMLVSTNNMYKLTQHNLILIKDEDRKKNVSGFTRISSEWNINGKEEKIWAGYKLENDNMLKSNDTMPKQTFLNIIDTIYSNTEIKSIPIFAYYSVNRSELSIDLSIETEKDLSEIYSLYDKTLNSVIHFKEFFKWFRDREDRENEIQLEKYKSGKKEEIYEDGQLSAVRIAIKSFLTDYDNFKVSRKTQDLILTAKGIELSINSLSDGEKGIIVLFGDIARQLAIANPNSKNPLEGDGIILIDEIELHLHPEWQRKIVPALIKTFPNCQFIITTHSPQVLGEIEPENIRLLNNFEVNTPPQSYGLDSNSVLAILQDSNSINKDVNKELELISKLTDEEKFDEARKHLEKLKERLHGSTPDTLSAETAINVLEA